MSIFGKVLRLLRFVTLRCPNCRGDFMPRNPYLFRTQCAQCGLIYQADEGDFWGSVVFSYTFAGVSGLTVAYVLHRLQWFGWETILYAAAGAAVASILLLFPFAKSAWIYTLFFTRGQYEEFRPKGKPGE